MRETIMEEDEISSKIPDNVKMAGYLEKKGKMVMKLMSPWKRYWFVLEGRLLLYYKSQLEYINLSPCRGSLNMGLASTVHPGASSGPHLIHVITRTQVVQLRAKTREVQKEWLQALLDAMALPLISSPVGHSHLRYSMDHLPTSNSQYDDEEWQERQRTLPYTSTTKTDTLKERIRNMASQHYGGSLDTVVKPKRMVRSPSPKIIRGKTVERMLGYVEEVEVHSLPEEDLHHSDGSKSEESVQNTASCSSISNIGKNEVKRRKHDENQNRPLTEEDDIQIFSKDGTEEDAPHLPPRPDLVNEAIKTLPKNSRLEKFRNAIKNIKTKDKHSSPEENKKSSIKKRRPSFLTKVFQRSYKKKEENPAEEDDSESEDPLYDTIKADSGSVNTDTSKPELEEPTEPEEKEKEPEYAIPIKEIKTEIVEYSCPHKEKIFGSKNIISEQAMSELKQKLKSRESLDKQDIEFIKISSSDKLDSELSEIFYKLKEKIFEEPPELPPRTGMRPSSPWHDVPRKNSIVYQQPPDTEPEEIERGSIEEENEESEKMVNHENELATLLSKLAEITTAPLLPPGKNSLTDTYTYTDDMLVVRNMRRRLSEPDYDIPRPHGPLLAMMNDRPGSGSERSSESMEPDSLETNEES